MSSPSHVYLVGNVSPCRRAGLLSLIPPRGGNTIGSGSGREFSVGPFVQAKVASRVALQTVRNHGVSQALRPLFMEPHSDPHGRWWVA